MKQRLAFRLLSASIGGLILGLGVTAFLFPLMDSITSFVIVVGSVAFLASWISGGLRFNYVGTFRVARHSGTIVRVKKAGKWVFAAAAVRLWTTVSCPVAPLRG